MICRILIIGNLAKQRNCAFILTGSQQPLRTLIPRRTGHIAAVPIIAQAVESILCGFQGRNGARIHGIPRLAIGAFLGQILAAVI